MFHCATYLQRSLTFSIRTNTEGEWGRCTALNEECHVRSKQSRAEPADGLRPDCLLIIQIKFLCISLLMINYH